MEYDKLFELDCAFERLALYVSAVGSLDFDDFRIVRGELILDNPLEYRQDSGGKAMDVIHTTLGPMLLSQRIVDLLNAEKFTGWSTYPVVIFNKHRKIIGGYSGLVITGRCGKVDYDRCPIGFGTTKEEPPEGYDPEPVFLGTYFENDTWDGSDIFTAMDRAHPIVTEEVKEVLEAIGITNAAFTRLTDTRIPISSDELMEIGDSFESRILPEERNWWKNAPRRPGISITLPTGESLPIGRSRLRYHPPQSGGEDDEPKS